MRLREFTKGNGIKLGIGLVLVVLITAGGVCGHSRHLCVPKGDTFNRADSSLAVKKVGTNDSTWAAGHDWRASLTEKQYQVTRLGADEPAFSGEFLANRAEGVYCCVCCDQPLFHTKHLFTSGSGWLSFRTCVDDVGTPSVDNPALAGRWSEVECTHCEAHLGYLFDNGPKPTGLRYCINSLSLSFVEGDGTIPETSPLSGLFPSQNTVSYDLPLDYCPNEPLPTHLNIQVGSVFRIGIPALR